MYVILQLQHSVGDVSNSTSSTVQSLTELVVFFLGFSLSINLKCTQNVFWLKTYHSVFVNELLIIR